MTDEKRLQPPPDDVREYVKNRLDALGPRKCSQELGVSRVAVFGTVLGYPVHPWTVAKVREAMLERGAS